MGQQLTDRLYEEMAERPRPSVDGLVEGAVTRGTTIRRRRRVISGAGTTALVGGVAAVVVLGGTVLPAHHAAVSVSAGTAPTSVALVQQAPATTTDPATATPEPSQAAAAAPDTAATTAPDVQAQITAQLAKLHGDKPGSDAAGQDKTKLLALSQHGAVSTPAALPPGVPATPTGMLELLTSLLPPGSTNHPGVVDDGANGVELYVSTPKGPGMVRVGLTRAPYVPLGCAGQAGCTVEPDGAIVTVRSIPDNCIGTESVEVVRPDGSDVAISAGDCLEWDGTQNSPSPLALTVAQARAIVLDPRWDVSMEPALVSAGATDFPSPHQFG